MKILKTIRDKDLGMDFKDPAVYEERKAARAIIFDKNNNVALLYAVNKSYHKLPGGGVEEGEDIIEALRSEVMEEIGCEIENIRELGIIEEFRNKISRDQTSYCFIANLAGEKGIPRLEADEIADGFETIWLNIDNAIETLENEKDMEHYNGRFINMRDKMLLEEAKKIL